DVNAGVGLQVMIPKAVRLYGGPYVYYSEASTRLSATVPGLPLGAGDDVIRNKSVAGGFAGADIALFKGFRLNIEGRYAENFSFGSAITYTY
ncbi:MAG: hypothetical protein R6W75_07485, partial [Smithellaceae bacterium]